MVFRGKPSKACQRCRERRLRCDVKKPQCSSCLRVGETCTGYREIDNVRFRNETDTVRTKALARDLLATSKHSTVALNVYHLPQDLQVVGREIFFAYYVSDFSRTWDFCFDYQDRHTTPEHLNLGIDAVSLAFLSHQVSSTKAKELSRQKYVLALRKINTALQSPNFASEVPTFQSALLLDLYEKLTKAATDENCARHAHVQGALALVKLRGVSSFTSGPDLRALLGLSLNATICALSQGSPIPPEVNLIRTHAAQYADTTYPKWRLSSVIIEIPNLADSIRNNTLSSSEQLSRSLDLDARLEAISLEAEPAWSFKRHFVSAHDPRISVPNDFFPVYDIYPNRTVTQMWNVLRLTRVLLCEGILEYTNSIIDPSPEIKEHTRKAEITIIEQIRAITASCPQMTNCTLTAKHKLPSGSTGLAHTHTMSHILDVYILIFALYVVAWAKHCPETARTWAVGQLELIREHFGIREAGVVLDILRDVGNGEDAGSMEREKDPWYVYGLLGYFGLCSVANT